MAKVWKYIRGDRFEEDVRADGKIVAVTGANSGIGQAIAAELNRRGAIVYMLIRNQQRGLESIKRLEESTDGRIINVSSVLYEYGDTISLGVVNDPQNYGGMTAYSRSKMAQVMYTRHLARFVEKRNLPITVTVCHPGNVDTNILKESGYQWNLRPIMWFVLMTDDDGAQMPLYLAVSKKLPKNSNGQYFRCA
ncbi:unnamed protein product [Heligmosomoides polygyrus]|uniref:Retinol dehydrogenase 12 n=1 Tax=Heligmosomoides polygyrus TaxID=6339 RepID=A0A183GFZ6_HELPZ|nr:unnamed protein product [Heligmosomoides polygyrus]